MGMTPEQANESERRSMRGIRRVAQGRGWTDEWRRIQTEGAWMTEREREIFDATTRAIQAMIYLACMADDVNFCRSEIAIIVDELYAIRKMAAGE